jgi:hypothetical protein
MKRVKIIANKPPIKDGDYHYYSDISEYVGREYDVLENWEDGTIDVDFGNNRSVIYPGEFEVIE